MAAPQGIVRVHHDGPTLMIQVEGWGTMVQSLPLRRYVEKALANGTTRLRIDLNLCQYLDSTFLGTLFLLKRMLQRRGGGEITLMGLSCPCKKLFEQMGVENFFSLVPPSEMPSQEWQELEGVADETHALHRNVVQAHQELASMDGKIGDTFRPVAQCLARDLPEQGEP
jgi:anti-sigma B factor antagonist